MERCVLSFPVCRQSNALMRVFGRSAWLTSSPYRDHVHTEVTFDISVRSLLLMNHFAS